MSCIIPFQKKTVLPYYFRYTDHIINITSGLADASFIVRMLYKDIY